MDYGRALSLLKTTFGGTTETPLWVNLVAKSLDQRAIKVLDVGIGDGDSITKKLILLRQIGFEPVLTGIDLSIDSVSDISDVHVALEHVNLICSSLETYNPGTMYDVVNASQSLYYSNDIEASLTKCIALTSPGRVIVITLWSDTCALYKIAYECANDTENLITAEMVASLLRARTDVESTQLYIFNGIVKLSEWNTTALLDAATSILTRDALEIISDQKRRDKLISVLHNLQPVEPRINGIIIAKRL